MILSTETEIYQTNSNYYQTSIRLFFTKFLNLKKSKIWYRNTYSTNLENSLHIHLWTLSKTLFQILHSALLWSLFWLQEMILCQICKSLQMKERNSWAQYLWDRVLDRKLCCWLKNAWFQEDGLCYKIAIFLQVGSQNWLKLLKIFQNENPKYKKVRNPWMMISDFG